MGVKPIVFENKGSIDLRSVSTFGMSVKENENPIGFFGTGLKYAIAICKRMGLELEMWVKGEKFSFTVQNELVRGKEFKVIAMNEIPLPFTTHLGANWELWQAFREFYCNSLDEGGDVSEGEVTIDPEKTYFIVRDARFNFLYNQRHTIVLKIDDKLKIPGRDNVEVFGEISDHIFYRGIRVLKPMKSCLFTYNIKDSQELTEDRTLKYYGSVDSYISNAIAGMTSKSKIRKALLAGKEFYEGDLSFLSLKYYPHRLSEEFRKVLEEEFKSNSDDLNMSARELCKELMEQQACKYYEPTELNPIEEKQLERAIQISKGVFPDFDYPIKVVKTLGARTMGLADKEAKTIILSQRAFQFGTKYIVSTLIEEFIHLKTGFPDLSRPLQTYLFDTICSLIENHVTLEPM